MWVYAHLGGVGIGQLLSGAGLGSLRGGARDELTFSIKALFLSMASLLSWEISFTPQ